MIDYICSLAINVGGWDVWKQFQLISSSIPASGNIFSFAEFLSALALLLVVLLTSDFRYRYRLSLISRNFQKFGFWLALCIGILILIVDVWFQNGLPVPKLIANANNVKAILGGVFLAFVFRIVYVAAIRPPVFAKRNAQQFFNVNYHFIHEGNPDRLRVIAEDLGRSIERIIAFAAKVPSERDRNDSARKIPQVQACAFNLLLLIGDRRFCATVVDKVPAFAVYCFEDVQKNLRSELPIFQFARNIGQEFIRNLNSSFYQEESGYFTGLVGYTRPVTNTIFGSYEFIEKCAADGASPLETDFPEFSDFGATQMEGYSRAALAFLESCLKVTKGRAHPHSYALVRMLYSFRSTLHSVSNMNGVENFYRTLPYNHLRVTIDFIRDAMELVEKHGSAPMRFPPSEIAHQDIYDRLADLIFEMIFASSTVSAPVWTAWEIQHNAVWSSLFSYTEGTARKIIAFKVRRLLYNEISEIRKFGTFKSARLLGYCLNIFGLTLIDRHKGYQKEIYPLQAAALSIARESYKRLLEEQPQVAAVCLTGGITYDAAKHQLVKTYAQGLRKEPNREVLQLH